MTTETGSNNLALGWKKPHITGTEWLAWRTFRDETWQGTKEIEIMRQRWFFDRVGEMLSYFFISAVLAMNRKFVQFYVQYSACIVFIMISSDYRILLRHIKSINLPTLGWEVSTDPYFRWHYGAGLKLQYPRSEFPSSFQRVIVFHTRLASVILTRYQT